MTTVELLKSMRSKIASGWTQGCCARNRGGFPVVPYSDDACQWCLIGSMTAEKGSVGQWEARRDAHRILTELIHNRNETLDMAKYNDADGRTREHILELIEEAIQVANVGGYV